MSKITTKLGKLVTTALAGTLLSFCVSAKEIPLDRVVAIVNDGVVLESELNARMAMVTEQLRKRGTRMPAQSILKKQVLDRLILDSLQLQIAQQQGIRISDRQLALALENIAQQNKLTLDQFRDSMERDGRSFDAVREQIRRELLISQVQRGLVNRRIRVTEQDLRNYMDSEEGKAKAHPEYHLSNILFAVPNQASPAQIQEAEQKARALYNELREGGDFSQAAIAYSNAPNALKGGDLGWRKLNELPRQFSSVLKDTMIGFISSPIRTPGGFHIVQVKNKRGGDKMLIEKTQVSHILLKTTEIRNPAQTRRKINELAQRLSGGESFEQLAKEYSDDPASGSEGGKLGWTQDGQMVPEFQQVMDSTPIGQTSEPFKSRFGWHILRVSDRRTEDVGSEMLENQARNAIRKRRFNEELSNWMREIQSQAYIEIKE